MFSFPLKNRLLSIFYFQTPDEFDEFSKQLVGDKYAKSKAIPYAYDAVWALALALNNTSAILNGETSLTDFSYNNTMLYETLKRELGSIHFEGVSVSFRKRRILILIVVSCVNKPRICHFKP